MYKIQFLFIMLLWGSGIGYAQQPGQRRATSVQLWARALVLGERSSNLSSNAQTHRPTVFTGHRLADRVAPSKKHAFDTLTGGQQASLFYPTRCQTLFQ